MKNLACNKKKNKKHIMWHDITNTVKKIKIQNKTHFTLKEKHKNLSSWVYPFKNKVLKKHFLLLGLSGS